jgi:enoyl-CoA hydratase
MSGAASLHRDAEVWTITLARPDKRNALSSLLVEELIDIVQRAPAEGAKVLVFRGEGRNFSAGFDFSDVERETEGDLVLRFIRVEMLLQAIGSSPCMTVALAHGRTFGAGVDIVASCRLRYATADSSFRMPGLKFGLVLGTRRFGEIVGRQQASALQEEAATFGAAQALEMRFLQGIVEQAEWPLVVERARAKAVALPEWSRNALYEVLSSREGETDLAWLVRSAARPGLKQRIADYLRAAQEK